MFINIRALSRREVERKGFYKNQYFVDPAWTGGDRRKYHEQRIDVTEIRLLPGFTDAYFLLWI